MTINPFLANLYRLRKSENNNFLAIMGCFSARNQWFSQISLNKADCVRQIEEHNRLSTTELCYSQGLGLWIEVRYLLTLFFNKEKKNGAGADTFCHRSDCLLFLHHCFHLPHHLLLNYETEKLNEKFIGWVCHAECRRRKPWTR